MNPEPADPPCFGMTLAEKNGWQRGRACKLHDQFKGIARRIESGASIGEELVRAAKMLDGLPLLVLGARDARSDRRVALRASAKSLRREWDRWCKGDPDPQTGLPRAEVRTAAALMLHYKAGCGGATAMPRALIREVQRRCTAQTGGRDKHQRSPVSAVHQQLCREFAERQPIPGIDYADYPAGAEFPWCYETVNRHKPGKALRLAGNVGLAAARGAQAFVSMNYTRLRKGELYTLDDVRLDILCMDEATGKAMQVVCYVLMEVGSRCIVAYVLKPAHAIKAEDVDELVAHGLQTPGFGIGIGYSTHILFERGTVACSQAAQELLQGVTEGRVKVLRTSMNGGVRWTGAPRDRATGNAAGKGAIESFHRRFHYSLLHLPGQRGNLYENEPAALGATGKTPFYNGAGKPNKKREHNGSMVDEAEKLAQFEIATGRRLKLQLPMLRFFSLNAAVRDAIHAHNHDPGHAYRGHGTFHQEETERGVWIDVEPRAEVEAAEFSPRSHEDAEEEGAEVSPPSRRAAKADSSTRDYHLAAPAKALSPQQRAGMFFSAWSAVEAVQPGANRFATMARVVGKTKLTALTDEELAKVLRVFGAMARKAAA